ncbi:Asp23/Gls24 family envelope stress response protein [Candidatus Epulonipiscium viviparus]|uniref:Asp23/Gls24 family envelope stress response protein n=1 Tax=Candidatus Epulonipiscium viviparus TaxID=420336 RepID=UPI00016C04B5|nr:Asp23/Gls24 family envelope stress response protein [Candidatus Epulopiscium viviparus]
MEKGIVQIADDVIAVIAQIAALEVNGLKSLAPAKQDIVQTITRKRQLKGIKVFIEEGGTRVSVSIKAILNYGFNVKKTCAQIQEKVKNSIETMTGLKVLRVDIQVVGVAFEQE